MSGFTTVKPILVLSLVTLLSACGSSDSENEQAPIVEKNSTPVITSQAITTAIEDQPYTYNIIVEDDDTSHTFSLNNGPEGMTISDEGEVEWLPSEGVLTSGEVSISVSDEVNTSVIQTFTIDVTPVNDAPLLSAVENQTIKSGDTFTLQVDASDPDDSIESGELTFSLLTAPDGMTINEFGLISYQALSTTTTLHSIQVEVTDGGEDGVEPAIVNFNIDEQYFVDINTVVKNYYNEDPIVGAEVSLTNGETIVSNSISDENGEAIFSVQDINLTERLSINGDAEGFSGSAIALNENQLTLRSNLLLQPVQNTMDFDPTVDASLAIDETILVELPANSLVRDDGSAVTDTVSAELTIINPAIDINLMPGDMITTDENGVVKPIESFGAITVTFADSEGRALNLAENSQAKINIPAVGVLAQTVPLYYFDENTGLWVKEGEAELINNSEGSFYTGMVSHFTTWNADRIYDTVFVNGCVVDSELNRVAGAQLFSEGRNYIGSSTARTDEDGMFSIPVKMNSEVLISTSAGVQSRTFTIVTTDVDKDIAECVQLTEAFTKIKLNWGETPSDLDSHLWGPRDNEGNQFHIYFGNKQVAVDDVVMFLDVDDTSSYGPEVISIPEFALPGTYTYKVDNYSTSPEIDPQTAKVELLINNQRYVFTPPEQGMDDSWYVFDIIVNDIGNFEVVEVNTYEPNYNYSRSSNSFLPSYAPSAIIESELSTYDKLIKGKYYAK